MLHLIQYSCRAKPCEVIQEGSADDAALSVRSLQGLPAAHLFGGSATQIWPVDRFEPLCLLLDLHESLGIFPTRAFLREGFRAL
jgi:hypothetical protein